MSHSKTVLLIYDVISLRAYHNRLFKLSDRAHIFGIVIKKIRLRKVFFIPLEGESLNHHLISTLTLF